MTFDELDDQLPFLGLHDAEVSAVSVNYCTRKVVFDLQVAVDEDEKESQWLYRDAKLTVSDFEYCVMDVPDPKAPYGRQSTVRIDAGVGEQGGKTRGLPEPRSGNFLMWVWVAEWNGFMHISARDLAIEWIGDVHPLRVHG